MRQRFLSRFAQRYLVRDTHALPSVGRPGEDLADSADWLVEEAEVAGTFHVLSASNRRESLAIKNGRLVFEEAVRQESGPWAFHSVGDTTEYQYVLSATDPNLALAVASPESPDGDYGLVLRPGRNRSAMWLAGPECVADARSIHLRYQTPDGVNLLYNEVYPEQAPPGTFFCTSGFGANARSSTPSGYAGIQHRPDGALRAIFSVWHRMADEERPVAGALATVVAAHPAATTTEFSGEGSGSSVRLPFDWRDNPTGRIRLCVAAESLGADTVLTAYIARGAGDWLSLGAIVRAETGGALMGHPYAFIEDFARTGNTAGVDAGMRSPYLVHSARFANPWFAGASKQLLPTTQARITAYGPHPLENLAAEISPGSGFSIRIATGGTSAESDPPIEASFTDSTPQNRPRPDLSGVPHL